MIFHGPQVLGIRTRGLAASAVAVFGPQYCGGTGD